MALSYCGNCCSYVYLQEHGQQACPVCSGALTETEEQIKARLSAS